MTIIMMSSVTTSDLKYLVNPPNNNLNNKENSLYQLMSKYYKPPMSIV